MKCNHISLCHFPHADPAGISCPLGCGGQATGVVVDEVADVEIYPAAGKTAGMKIDIDVHAAHVSIGRALADAAGAEYVLSEKAVVSIPFEGVRDGDEVVVCNDMKALETPGHAPEHISFVVTDRTCAAEPWFVVTGHTLIIGDLSRTELAVSAEGGAEDLFKSIQKLKAPLDYLQDIPGAYADLVRGRHLSANPISTIGFEQRHNKAFRIDSEADFVIFMLQDIPPTLPEAAKLRAANSGRAAAMA